MWFVLLNMYLTRKKQIQKPCSYSEASNPPCAKPATKSVMVFCPRCASESVNIGVGPICEEHISVLEFAITNKQIGHVHSDQIYPAEMVSATLGKV